VCHDTSTPSISALAAGAAALPAASRIARAQAYPTRPVRFIVAFAAGGSNDIVARLMGQWLSERLGQPLIIENRPGAGSNIGTEVVVRAPPDGYMLLMVGAPNAINATLYEKLSFDFIRDIAPVAGILRVPLVRCIRRFQFILFPSSWPMPKPIPARSIMHRQASEA
jgi:tripartite-type tricarboxylate transporter receptor subunit TctC